jgi:hypothetical protein
MPVTMDGEVRTSRAQLGEWVYKRGPLFAWLGVVAVLLTLFSSGRRHIANTAPYVQHIDERTLMRGARRVLQDDGLNPRIYNYPSLPFYLAAAGVAGGAVKASARGPEQLVVKKLGRLEPPYYDHLALGVGARTLWLILALGCVAAAAGCAYALAGSLAALTSSVVLGLAGVPTLTASSYVSVDVPLALFCSILFAQLACTFGSTSYRDRVWMPALVCGAAIACKYTGVVTLVPALLAIWLTNGPARLGRSVELLLFSALVFFMLCPRFLIDLPKFVDGISYESHHYGFKGHKHFTAAPGWSQLWLYVRDSADAFGVIVLLLAALGFGTYVRTAPRSAAVLASFPLVWLAMLCGAKVHFPRNLLPVLLWLGVFAAAGVGPLWRAAGELGTRLRARRGAVFGRVAVLLVLIALLPWQRTWERHHRTVDSRITFAHWSALELREPASLVVPSALPFAEETLRKNLQVKRVDLKDANATSEATQPGAYMLMPNWTSASGAAQQIAELAPGMNALPRHRVVKEFDGNPVSPFLESELSINPGMRLVRFE